MTRDELIEQNLALVRSCVRRFQKKGIEYDELYASGLLGLVKAAKKFDPDLGFRFSTYAVPVILGEIKRLFRDGGSVKVSRSLKELSLKAKGLCDSFFRDTGEEMPVGLLAEKLCVSVYQASLALSVSLPPVSLSASEEGDALDIPVPSDEDSLIDRLSLEQALRALSKDERDLIELRYFQHKTQTQTAEKLSCTQVQVSRKEKKILTKLRMMLI